MTEEDWYDRAFANAESRIHANIIKAVRQLEETVEAIKRDAASLQGSVLVGAVAGHIAWGAANAMSAVQNSINGLGDEIELLKHRR